MQNGARIYVAALPIDDVDAAVGELNKIGESSGGTAIG